MCKHFYGSVMPLPQNQIHSLFEQDALHSLVIDSLDDQIVVIDRHGTIIYANRAWTRLGIESGMDSGSFGTGCNYLEVCTTFKSSDDHLAGDAARKLHDVLCGRQDSLYFEYPYHSPKEERWFMMRVTPLQGKPTGYFVISHHDITLRKLAESKAEHLSLHDPLTGLANRRYFKQFLSIEWRRNTRSRSPLSFIMFDIDHFKDYNDHLGHVAGDKCLIKVAPALRAFSRRPRDLAVRYGGEEFGLLLGETGLEQSFAIAEKVRKEIYDLDIFFGGERRITVSAGVASAVPDNEHEDVFLVQEADKALYRAKQLGRNQIAYAQP
jgi:diguanylate cyclase (GGDEF)-like protein